jgi:protein-disulfide isomerase
MKLHAVLLAALLPAFAALPTDMDAGKVIGDPNAPVRIDVYSDFACPHCRAFHDQMVPVLMRDYVGKGKLSIVPREFPINPTNFKYSRTAALWATAAARMGKYQIVSDKLFQTQAEWNASGKVAETVLPLFSPADQKKLQALTNDPGVVAEVQNDSNAGHVAGVNQTPTLVVRRGSKSHVMTGIGPQNYYLLKSLIDGLLQQ